MLVNTNPGSFLFVLFLLSNTTSLSSIHLNKSILPSIFRLEKDSISSTGIKGESFRPGTKISSNYNDHTFEVFI